MRTTTQKTGSLKRLHIKFQQFKDFELKIFCYFVGCWRLLCWLFGFLFSNQTRFKSWRCHQEKQRLSLYKCSISWYTIQLSMEKGHSVRFVCLMCLKQTKILIRIINSGIKLLNNYIIRHGQQFSSSDCACAIFT